MKVSVIPKDDGLCLCLKAESDSEKDELNSVWNQFYIKDGSGSVCAGAPLTGFQIEFELHENVH